MVYLNDACLSAIDAYVKVRPKDDVVDRNALFLSNRGTRISPKTVQAMVNKYLTVERCVAPAIPYTSCGTQPPR